MSLTGDPVWLPEVLRAEGLRCDIFPGAFERGHGDFGSIWGVVAHHTGSFGETPNGIANHPSLGLASQLFLHRDGYYVLCGVGVAWHAGTGAWPGLPTNGANQHTIGIEAQNDGGGSPGKRHHIPWSDVQYDAYVRGCAAICRKLREDSSHVIGHKDWAGPTQGKWDPGGIDMNIMRADIQRRIFPAQPGQTDPVLEMLAMASNQEKLDWIYDELHKPFASRAMYRDSDQPLDTIAAFHLWTNGTGYDSWIETQAKQGDKASIAKVERLAKGEGPAGDEPDKVQHAKDFLEYLKAQGKAV